MPSSPRYWGVLLFLLVPIGAFLIGALFSYGWRMYPRTGLGLLIDDVTLEIHSGMSYDEVVELLGPEEGRLSDDVLLRNLRNRYVAFEQDANRCLPNEQGGMNMFWLNEDDGRVWIVVVFDRDRDVVCLSPVESSSFAE